ncbi:mRNA interferase MazF [Granulicella rosea]|uniref:mRNA interferase MazF n=1 Tax=Granulicella rosea TaxID=474952 RepID=A0A239IC99_9BACT|nr:MazF family transcriptional regulator [Granulicella rosea]SNS90693.1 mRNA interferase MazF [Granulicella rosea]
MGLFAAGEVVLFPFPFSDLSGNKLRPVLLLVSVSRADWIGCQITSNPYSDPHAVVLTPASFTQGGLQLLSYARPGKLFTANESIFVRSLGKLADGMLKDVRDSVVSLIQPANP